MSSKKWALLGAVTLIAIYVFYNPGAERFLVPQGYMGPVVIVFSHPQGQPLERTWRAYIYRIPRDGILRIKDDSPDGFKLFEWVYVDSEGNETFIPLEEKGSIDHTVTTPRVRFGGSGFSGPIAFINAEIGIPADNETFGSNQ